MNIWRTLSKREKRYGIGAALALVGFLLFRLVLAPELTRYAGLRERERELEAKFLQAQSNVMIRDAVLKTRETYEREISAQGSEQEEQSFLLREIERLGRDLPLRIRGMRPLPSEAKGFYKRFAVSMEIEGSVEHTMQFVHLVENSTRLLRVEKLQLSADGKKRGQLCTRLLVSRPAIQKTSSGNGNSLVKGGK